MIQVFVDTGAWYALIDRKDPDHVDVAEQLRLYQGRLVTSNFVSDETVTLLRYRLGHQYAVIFWQQLMAGTLANFMRITPKDEFAAWKIFHDYDDKSFSFTDCTSFALMERLKLDVAIALDSDFKSYGFHCLP